MRMTEIHSAAYDGDMKKVGELLDEGADANATYSADAWTPLHLASKRGHAGSAQLLLDRGADVSARDSGGWTPLHHAGSPEVAALLLARGADVNARDNGGYTPLGRALGTADMEAVLREHGGLEHVAEASPEAKTPPGSQRKDPEMSSSLDALLIVFDREFSPTQPYVDYILGSMKVHGGFYGDFVGPTTPRKTLVDPKAQDPHSYMALAFVQFAVLLGERFDLDMVEVATFEGPETRGVVLSHWSN